MCIGGQKLNKSTVLPLPQHCVRGRFSGGTRGAGGWELFGVGLGGLDEGGCEEETTSPKVVRAGVACMRICDV